MVSFENAPDPWQTLKGFAPFPLREINGSKQNPSKPWQDWHGKQGVFMLEVPGNGPAYIGMTADGKVEAGLSDRLYGLNSPSEPKHRELADKKNVPVTDCLVYVIEIKDPESRKVAKKVGIKHFRPIGNHLRP